MDLLNPCYLNRIYLFLKSRAGYDTDI